METIAAALPTLWPHMVWGTPRAAALPPFSRSDARFFYFARNAVWRAVGMLGLQGREVLMPAYHHGVEVEALIDAGAHVRFYRVDCRWEVDLEDVERRIGPRTGALYLTHYAGFPGPVAELRAMADRHGLRLIEDCALSLLSSGPQGPLGLTGDLGIFCLYKTLPVPNGGALIQNRPVGVVPGYTVPPPLASTLSHALSSLLMNAELRGGTWGRWVRRTVRSVGARMVGAVQAERVATGTQHFRRDHLHLGMSGLSRRVAQLQDLESIVERRRRNYFFLLARLRDRVPPLFQELPAGVCPLFYPLVVPDKEAALAFLRAEGIEAIDFWRAFHPACDATEFPEVAALRGSVVELPCHQDLGFDAMERIAAAVHRFLAARGPAQRQSARG